MTPILTENVTGALAAQSGTGGTGLLAQGTAINLLTQSGSMVQLVLYLLLVFSAMSWGIIFYKLYQIRQARRTSRRFNAAFRETRNLDSLHTASLEMTESPVAQVFRAAYQELMRITRGQKQTNPPPSNPITESSGGEGSIENIELAMRREMREQISWLERALTFLATTASTAPFIGLFGTVWGIMNAFEGLSKTQTASIQAVAPGIAEALIATAVGLFAAIPAVMAYNHFSRQVRVIAGDMESFSAEFLHLAKHYFS